MIQCLAREDMLAHLKESVGFHIKGDRYAAMFHSRIAMDVAAKLNDAAAHRVMVNYRKVFRGLSPCVK